MTTAAAIVGGVLLAPAVLILVLDGWPGLLSALARHNERFPGRPLVAPPGASWEPLRYEENLLDTFLDEKFAEARRRTLR
jgi:hypothetical protein